MKSERTIHRRKQDRAFKMEEFLYRRAVSGRLRPRIFVLFPWTGHRNFRLFSRRSLPSSTTLHWLSCVPYSLAEKSRSAAGSLRLLRRVRFKKKGCLNRNASTKVHFRMTTSKERGVLQVVILQPKEKKISFEKWDTVVLYQNGSKNK